MVLGLPNEKREVSLMKEAQVMKGAPLLRRQSSQWQWVTLNGRDSAFYRIAPQRQEPVQVVPLIRR